jgi:hypothetical protein
MFYYSEPQIYYTEYITYHHRIHLYYNTSLSIVHFFHIILKQNICMCHNIIAFHSILIARMAKPTGKTKKTIQAKLGSLTKAGTKGKKRSASSKNIALPISNKQKKSQGSSFHITNLAAATHDNDTDSIVDQDDDDDVVLAGIPNHSFLSLQALQAEVIDHDVNKEDDTTTTTTMITIILEWSIMQLFIMEEKTLLLLSIKPDYQLVLAVQMLLQV